MMMAPFENALMLQMCALYWPSMESIEYICCNFNKALILCLILPRRVSMQGSIVRRQSIKVPSNLKSSPDPSDG